MSELERMGWEAFLKYARHIDDCVGGTSVCTCGARPLARRVRRMLAGIPQEAITRAEVRE